MRAVGREVGFELDVVGAHDAIRAPAGRSPFNSAANVRPRLLQIAGGRCVPPGERGSRARGGLACKQRRRGCDRAHLVEVAVAMKHHIAAGRERRARALGERAGQRSHRYVVAHQQSPKPNRIANHLPDHCDGCCGRREWIVGAEHNMCGHAERQAGERPERREIGRFERVPVGIDHRQPLVAVHRRAAVTGQMLEHRQHAAVHQPGRDRAGERRDLIGRVAIGAVADHCVGARDRNIGERQAIDVDAERLADRWRSAGRRVAPPQARLHDRCS